MPQLISSAGPGGLRRGVRADTVQTRPVLPRDDALIRARLDVEADRPWRGDVPQDHG